MSQRVITSPWPDPGLVESRWPGGVIMSPWPEDVLEYEWPVEAEGGSPPVDPPDPQDSAILWVTSNQGVAGTGDQVDSWATRSSSGLTLTEGGAGKPLQLGRRVDLDNESTQTNFFTVGTVSTFEAITSTGIFTLAWRGTIDVLDGLSAGVNGMLLVTKSDSRGCFLGYNSTLMNFTATDDDNNIMFRVLDNDWGADVELGAQHDYVIQGDGTTVRMYRLGVEVDSDTITTQAGSHQLTPRVGISANSGAYQIGSTEGIFYDDKGPETYSVAEARALVTVARTFEASDYGTPIAEYSARWGYQDAAAVSRLVDESGGGHTLVAPSGSNEAVHVASGPHNDFDGSDYYRGADKAPFDPLHQTPQGTVVARVALRSATSGARHGLFSTATFTKSNTGVAVIIDDQFGTNRVRAGVFPSGPDAVYDLNSASADLSLSDGEFVVVAAAWDGVDMRLYAGGAFLVSEAIDGAPNAGTSTRYPEVGALAGTTDIDGLISDVIVFSDKLDATAVANLTTALEALYV